MSLTLLRHTRPDIAEGICYGRSDLALAACFETSAAAALAGLPQVGEVISSPLSRCLRLAERIAGVRRLPLRIEPRIVEMDFGSWEGQPWAEIPRAELDAWAADFEGARPHGGESPAMLAARVKEALEETGSGPVLWVTHAGVVRAACALRGAREGWETRLPFGTWLTLERA